MALNMNSSNEVEINQDKSTDLFDLEEFTWSMWIKISSSGNLARISQVNSANVNKRIFSYFYSISAFSFSVARDAGNDLKQFNNVSLVNIMHHLLFTYKLGDLNAYLDGTVLTSPTLVQNGTGGIAEASGRITTTFVGSGANFDWAEFGIWNRILNSTEIANLSNSSNPYTPTLISDGLIGAWRLMGTSENTFEPDYARDNRAVYVGTPTIASHPSNIITRVETASPVKTIGESDPSFMRGTIIAQKINLESSKVVSKSSLFLNPMSHVRLEQIQEENGVVSFSAANFQSITEDHSWDLDITDVSSYNDSDTETIDQGYLTNSVIANYTTSEEAFLTAPRVSYDLFLGVGVYKVWCRSKGSTNFWWSWNPDELPQTHIMGTNLIWRQLGDLNIETPEIKTLTLYLGVASINGIKIDQFYLQKVDDNLLNQDLLGQEITYPLTSGPYNTLCRARIAPVTGINDLTVIVDKGWGWKSSNSIYVPGNYNYKINDFQATNLSLEFVVISGNADFNAQWNFAFDEEGNKTYRSTDYGVTFAED